MNKKYKILLSTILVSSAILTIYKIKDNLVSISSIESKNLTDNQDKSVSEVVLQKLSILGDKCRGCGKCVQIDPEHFEINGSTRKAIVISSLNLDSVALQQAINNCRDRAIELS